MKYKIKKFFSLILLAVIGLFSFSGCTACARTQWKQVYDAYVNEKDRFVYYNIYATIINFNEFSENKYYPFKLAIDEEDFLERYKTDSKVEATLGEFKRQSFYFVNESIKNLEQSGFFMNVNENTVITFTVNDYIGWDGWQYPVFEVKVDDKTYLDFETGYTNVINYVKTKIDNP